MKGMLRSGLGLLCGMLLAQPSAPRIDKKVALVDEAANAHNCVLLAS